MQLKILEKMPDFKLIGKDVGDYGEHTACVMSATVAEYRLRNGKPLGEAVDELDCVCPVMRVLAIRRNDGPWESDAARTQWGLSVVPLLLDSRCDDATIHRGEHVARAAVREIAPMALRAAGFMDDAERLEALPKDVDMPTAARAARATSVARGAARAADAVSAADAAARAADAAAARAADAASAADAAARAIARATAHAADAAARAADAASAADAAARATDATDAADAWHIIERLIVELVEID